MANYLESIEPALCARYLEYIVEERKEESPAYHDRLAELYLKMTLSAKSRGDERKYALQQPSVLLIAVYQNHGWRCTKNFCTSLTPQSITGLIVCMDCCRRWQRVCIYASFVAPLTFSLRSV